MSRKLAVNKLSSLPTQTQLKDFDNFIGGSKLNEVSDKIEDLRKTALFYFSYTNKKIPSICKKPNSEDLEIFSEFTKG